jgi:hypothetical protein
MSMFLAVQAADNSKFLIITVVAIVLGLVISGFLESKILIRLGWTTADKAVGFVAATNMITPVLAFVFLAAVFAVFIVLGVKSFTNFQEQGTLKILVYMLFPLLIVILRRQMLSILKIRNDIWSWVYAFVSTKITFWFMFIAIVIFYEILK